MKRISLIALWAALCAGFLYLSNCSRPLDVNDIGPFSPDTVFVTDTLTDYDTVYFDTLIIDTLIIDTLIIDTLIIDTLVIDTLFIDSSRVDTMYCARLNSHRQSIAWLLFNQQGLYELEFLASVEGRGRVPELVIEVDGESYSWDLSVRSDYIIEQHIDPYAIVRIRSNPPHAYGRSIDICMRVTPR